MRKNLIITINDNGNYGNRLQNYALSVLLEAYGAVTTAKCNPYISNTVRDSLSPSFSLLRSIRDYFNYFWRYLHKDYLFLRFKKNISFTQKYIPDDVVTITPFRLTCKDDKDFSHIVLGSDQVWNFNGMPNVGIPLSLGYFNGISIPVISYAASFGVSEVEERVKPFFQKYLPRLKAISVREDRGAEMVKEMTGLEATVVLDPTLMLTSDKWLEITENFVSDNDRYVLTYFLGRPSDEQERDIQAYAKEHGCRVRRMLDLRDKETYVAGPQDFVELFSKAQYVFTDSYHACCFSILFHKQFTVFNRAGMTGKSSMNSRMETLFRLFDLDSVMMDSGLAPEIDYVKVDRLLEQHRRESQAWLDMAMEE